MNTKNAYLLFHCDVLRPQAIFIMYAVVNLPIGKSFAHHLLIIHTTHPYPKQHIKHIFPSRVIERYDCQL